MTITNRLNVISVAALSLSVSMVVTAPTFALSGTTHYNALRSGARRKQQRIEQRKYGTAPALQSRAATATRTAMRNPTVAWGRKYERRFMRRPRLESTTKLQIVVGIFELRIGTAEGMACMCRAAIQGGSVASALLYDLNRIAMLDGARPKRPRSHEYFAKIRSGRNGRRFVYT